MLNAQGPSPKSPGGIDQNPVGKSATSDIMTKERKERLYRQFEQYKEIMAEMSGAKLAGGEGKVADLKGGFHGKSGGLVTLEAIKKRIENKGEVFNYCDGVREPKDGEVGGG